jgi:P-type E1-E2 ATPase
LGRLVGPALPSPELPVIELNIPGRGALRLEHLVSDVNGTLAVDGRLVDGASRALIGLGDRLTLHLLTADTHGQQDRIDQQLGLKAVRIPPGNEAEAKARYVRKLGAERVVAIGQGANDSEMLREAGLGIAVHSTEGLAVETLGAADVVVTDILVALALLQNPMRLVATLRK